jgi:hypothetical protein
MVTYCGYTATVRLLIQEGANVNATNEGGYTALRLAVYRDYIETAYTILSTMTPQQITKTVDSYPRLQKIVTQYNEELRKHKNTLFSIFGRLLLAENQVSFHSSNYAMLPTEILTTMFALKIPKWCDPYLAGALALINKVKSKRLTEVEKQEQPLGQEVAISPAAIIFSADANSKISRWYRFRFFLA